jgi:GT2 family glycosyltransferase
VQIARELRTPVIVTRGFGAEELVRDGVDGLVVNRDELGNALQKLVRDRSALQALTGRAGEPPTLVREVDELEFRYRGMACLQRENVLPSAIVAKPPGRSAEAAGDCVLQGDDWILLRPGGEARFPIRDVPHGPVEFEIVQQEFGVERGAVLAGDVEFGGEPIGAFAPSRRKLTPSAFTKLNEGLRAHLPDALTQLLPALPVPPPDRKIVGRFRSWIDDDTQSLVIRARTNHARIERVLVRSHTTTALRRAVERDTSPEWQQAEELRVWPGARLSAAELPRIAVIVPTFDGRDVLEACLASVAGARYDAAKLAIVVVDNGSSDGTSEFVASRHPAATVVRFERNRGFAAACNAGAHATDARVLVFLNNDMRVDPEFFVELVSPVARAECAATVAKRLSWDGSKLDGAGVGATFAGIAIQPGYGLPPGPEHDIPRRTLFPCGGAMAIDAATFRDVGGFDEEFFAYYEDLDLGWRMWVMGHATHYVPRAIAYHHHSFTSKRLPQASVRLVMIRNSLLACVKNYDDANLERVLPVILALATRRAHIAAGLDGDAESAARKVLRIENAGADALAPSGSRSLEDQTVAIRALGAADLVAIDDLLGRWEHWMRRRLEVQTRRRKHDYEIFPMFLDPLACVEADSAYHALQSGLTARYRIPEMFAARVDPAGENGHAPA